METKILSAADVDVAAETLKNGGLVAIPTETVYGLAGDAMRGEIVRKIYEAKGRPSDNPLIVHIAKIEDVFRVSDDVPEAFFALAEKFMPGPLTVVVPKGKAVPYEVTGGGETVAVRMPSHPLARAVIERSGCLLAAPSANVSKHVSPTTAKHVYDDLNGKIPYILDGGECGVGIESTVVSVVADVPTVLRPGYITAEMLGEVLGEVKNFEGKVIKTAPAPGMKYKHYAPRCEAALAANASVAVRLYEVANGDGKNPVILAYGDNKKRYGSLNVIDLGDTPADAAHRIYAALREAEDKFGYIIVDKLPDGGLASSVMNRILKATANE